MTPMAQAAPDVASDFLIVGAGIAAVTAAGVLRNEGAEGSILILSAEAEYPYKRPPLTKRFFTGEMSSEQLLLQAPDYYRNNRIDMRRGCPVRSVDCSRHQLTDHKGVVYSYGKLLLATGAQPARLQVPGAGRQGVFTFRTRTDSAALRQWVLAHPGPVGIVGTSFIAMELATSLTRMGLKVTLVDRASTVFPRIHSTTLSQYFLERCHSHGIDVICGTSISRILGDAKVRGLMTTSGQTIDCVTVIVAIGAIPTTDYLDRSGIDIEDGILVDEFLQTNQEDVYAAGDVASYLDRYGQRHRARHWENARKQGRIAAKNMLGQRVPYNSVLHYFCDFLDFSFTFLGSSENADRRIARGSLADKSFAEFYLQAGRVIGLFSTGRPPEETQVVETLIRDRIDVQAAHAQLADSKADITPLAQETVLILQGGGALGAFECGVVCAMVEAGITPGIVGGVSIGAINGAIIAGNPRDAASALESFWNEISIPSQSMTPPVANALAIGGTMAWGIPDFFRPRWLSPVVQDEYWPHQWTSLYDNSPLKHLLGKYVDFSRLSESPIRLLITAVDVDLGELVVFDSRTDEITADHVLASGSLPPVFPWTTINGRRYWDGGIISNSPLEQVLNRCGADNKQIFVVDLFPGERPLPSNLAEVFTRRDEIIYGERVRNDSHIHELIQEFRALIGEIMLTVEPDEAARLRQRPRYVHLMGQNTRTSIVHFVRDGSAKEPLAAHYDFSVQALSHHTKEGYQTAQRVLASLDPRTADTDASASRG